MRLIANRVAVVAALGMVPGLLNAQFDFKVDGRPVQVHSFVQQGFAYSDQNNYLTMKTSQGSFAMTDGGVNVGMSITDKFHVGAQLYLRNIGELGKWQPQLDWAYGDYKFKGWFGVRGGKVKTALGLYNDTQDAEFLHTWALLPQSVYPLDLRSTTIAHTGGDIYGEISLHQAGKLDYTGYFGARSFDPRGGVYYFSADQGIPILKDSGYTAGGDLRWTTPVPGLMLGGSWANLTEDRNGHWAACLKCAFSIPGMPYKLVAAPDHITAAYLDFASGKWHLDGEFRREHYYANITSPAFPGPPFQYNGSNSSWFVSAAYRVSKRLELGTYHSAYYFDAPSDPANTSSNHIFDQAVTARFDLARWWNVKVEGHFMDGYGEVYSAHGFYTRSNMDGLQPKTNMLVLRTGFTF